MSLLSGTPIPCLDPSLPPSLLQSLLSLLKTPPPPQPTPSALMCCRMSSFSLWTPVTTCYLVHDDHHVQLFLAFKQLGSSDFHHLHDAMLPQPPFSAACNPPDPNLLSHFCGLQGFLHLPITVTSEEHRAAPWQPPWVASCCFQNKFRTPPCLQSPVQSDAGPCQYLYLPFIPLQPHFTLSHSLRSYRPIHTALSVLCMNQDPSWLSLSTCCPLPGRTPSSLPWLLPG